MPYRFALSREQRSTLPLVNSFLLRDCKNGHFLPRNVYSLDRCISFFFSSSSFFYFFPRKRKSRVSETRRSSIKVGEICVSAIYHPPLSVTFPFARRTSILARVRSSFVDPSPPQLSPSIPRQPRLLVLWRCSRGARRAR